jgi:hypothetical protein
LPQKLQRRCLSLVMILSRSVLGRRERAAAKPAPLPC